MLGNIRTYSLLIQVVIINAYLFWLGVGHGGVTPLGKVWVYRSATEKII